MPPPRSILAFRAIYLGFAFVWCLHTLLTAQGLTILLTGNPIFAAYAEPIGGYLTMIAKLAFVLAVIWCVVERASNIARWVAVALCGLWLDRLPQAWPLLPRGHLPAMLWVVGSLLSLGAVLSLFRTDARAWFDGHAEGRR